MATKRLSITIQLKRGTTEEWDRYGAVVPAVGEPCLDITTGHLRFGDGVTAYKDLPDIAEVYNSRIVALQETDDALQQNIEQLFTLIGTEDGGLTKDISDLRLYVGEIPDGSDADNVITYLHGYVEDSLEAEHANKDVLDEITQAKVNQWNQAEANVIDAIQVNGSAVPVSDKIANIILTTPEGGSLLPEVTTADNGKFLRVVNGVWMADDVTDVSREGM